MPLKPGSSKPVIGENIREFHTGKTYAHTMAKFGKAKANKQAIAVALSTARKYRGKAEGGEVEDDKPVDAPVAAPAEPKKVYIYPNLAEDLTKKTPLEGREPSTPSMTATPQTPRDTLASWLRGADTKSYEPRARLAEKAMNVLDFTPPMQALEAGQEAGKGHLQEAALYALPGVKKAKEGFQASFALMHAAGANALDSPIAAAVQKQLKAEYPKDIAAAVIENKMTPEQIENVKTYMSPGAQAAFDKHYGKMAPKIEPTFEPYNQPQETLGDILDKAKANLKLVPKEEYKPVTPNFGTPINMDNMQKIGGPLGSNPGGMYEGISGHKYYIKQGQSPDHVKNELIAASLYDAAGVPTLKYHPVEGGNHIATQWEHKQKDNAYKLSPEEKARAQEDFAVHAWLANHDVVGLGGDNLGIIKGRPTVLDTGGALEYRAQGAPKGDMFGTSVGELESMRGLTPGIKAPDAAHMFGDMDYEAVQNSALKVVSIPDQKIKDIVAAHGGNPDLADKLIARKMDMADRFGLQPHDPDFVQKHFGDNYEKEMEDIKKSIYKDTDIEDYYASQEKHSKGPEWEPDFDHTPEFDIPKNSSPWHEYHKGNFSKTQMLAKLDEHLTPSNWLEFKPRDVPAEKIPPLNFGGNDPAKLKELGFNTKVPIYKGGHFPNFMPGSYPETLMDPMKMKDTEKAFFAATHKGIAQEYHGMGEMGGEYIARAPKFFEFDWPAFFGSNHYSDGEMHYVIDRARAMGADVVAIHNMHDIGSSKHGAHTQLAFLNTHVLRAPTAQFNPEKLHLRYPLAGLAGGGIMTYGALGGEGNKDKMKRGGKVAKKEENPKDHEFIDFKRGGMIDSNIPGRTDKIPMKVSPGSYVLPADIPSALGQGNTKAGSEVLNKMFTHSAYGLKPMTQKAQKFHFDQFRKLKADGGGTQEGDDHVPIIAAGGEYIIHPDVVKAVGHGDMTKGHKVLDKFVLHTRKQHIKTLRKLKPPKK